MSPPEPFSKDTGHVCKNDGYGSCVYCAAAMTSGHPTEDAFDYRSEKWPTPEAKEWAGLRYSDGKNRLDLLPPEWEWELGLVLTSGAKKYADRNWEKGMDWHNVAGPLRRHLNKWLRGERDDQETGCHHLAMVAWNALALMTYEMRGIGKDDLDRRDHIKEPKT